MKSSRDFESGQASLEYVLLLMVMVVTIVAVSKNLLIPFFKKASEGLGAAMQGAFKGEKLHQFPIGGK